MSEKEEIKFVVRKIKTIVHFDYTPHNARNKYHKEIKEFVVTAKDVEDLEEQIHKIKNDLESTYLGVNESFRTTDYYSGWDNVTKETEENGGVN